MDEDEIERLEERLERERRQQAERLAESSTRDLYRRSQELASLKEENERLLWVAYHHLQEPVRGGSSRSSRCSSASWRTRCPSPHGSPSSWP